MAAPFGKAPTFGEYLAWARKNGCVDRCGYVEEGGHVTTVVRIEASDGKYTIEAMDQAERLLPRVVARLDRRLGLSSPYFKDN